MRLAPYDSRTATLVKKEATRIHSSAVQFDLV